MYFKSALLAMALTVSAVLAAVEPGTYRITNNAVSNAWVRSYTVDDPIFVTLTKEGPGSFMLRDLTSGENEGSFTIRSVGLDAYVVSSPEEEGRAVVATRSRITPTQFQISPADDEFYTIQVANKDLLWAVEPDVRSPVKLQGADGSANQRWIIQRVEEEVEASGAEAGVGSVGPVLGSIISKIGGIIFY